MSDSSLLFCESDRSSLFFVVPIWFAILLSKSLPSDKILSLGRLFDNKIANQIGTTKNNELLSDSQKSKELSDKVSSCISKINQMPYNKLLMVIDQHSIGGVDSATNYILTGTRTVRFTRSKIT